MPKRKRTASNNKWMKYLSENVKKEVLAAMEKASNETQEHKRQLFDEWVKSIFEDIDKRDLLNGTCSLEQKQQLISSLLEAKDLQLEHTRETYKYYAPDWNVTTITYLWRDTTVKVKVSSDPFTVTIDADVDDLSKIESWSDVFELPAAYQLAAVIMIVSDTCSDPDAMQEIQSFSN